MKCLSRLQLLKVESCRTYWQNDRVKQSTIWNKLEVAQDKPITFENPNSCKLHTPDRRDRALDVSRLVIRVVLSSVRDLQCELTLFHCIQKGKGQEANSEEEGNIGLGSCAEFDHLLFTSLTLIEVSGDSRVHAP